VNIGQYLGVKITKRRKRYRGGKEERGKKKEQEKSKGKSCGKGGN
jgi:hypothetical protein